tara:strand:- start:65 stop:367 length:303 start_codon:yes stop_codon:yes gene_type:complete
LYLQETWVVFPSIPPLRLKKLQLPKIGIVIMNQSKSEFIKFILLRILSKSRKGWLISSGFLKKITKNQKFWLYLKIPSEFSSLWFLTKKIFLVFSSLSLC